MYLCPAFLYNITRTTPNHANVHNNKTQNSHNQKQTRESKTFTNRLTQPTNTTIGLDILKKSDTSGRGLFYKIISHA